MSPRIPFIIGLILIAGSLHAQPGSIRGHLIDTLLQRPISGATIRTASGQSAVTSELGIFRINTLHPGTETLYIASIGFRADTVRVEVLAGRETNTTIPLHVQSLQLSQVVVSAASLAPSGNPMRVDMRLRPVNTGQDLLRIVPGLFIAQHAGGGKAEQLFLRGYDVDHGTDIAVTVDGIPVNMPSHAHGQGYADAHFVIPETVERMEFDKGPYFASKGDFATAGWVNFATKDFLSHNTVKAEAGLFGYHRAAALVRVVDKSTTAARQQFYVASEYFATDGYFNDPQRFQRINLFGKYTLLSNKNARLQVTASTFDSRWNASGQIPLRAVENGLIDRFGSIDNSEGGATGRSNVNVQFNKQWNSNWRTTDQAYFSSYRFNLYSNFTFFLRDPQNGDGIQQREQRRLFGYQGSTARDYTVGDKTWSTELGYGFRYDDVRNIELNAQTKRQFLSHLAAGSVGEGSAYAYLQQHLYAGRRFDVTAALRFERFSFAYNDRLNSDAEAKQHASVLLPKLRVAYQAASNLTVYASAGTGFHSNDARLLASGEVTELLPRVWGSDLGAVYKPAKEVLIKAALWLLDAQQEFVYVGDEAVVEPSGSARRVGIDVSVRARLRPWLFADADLNVASARFRNVPKGESYVPLAPTVTSIGGLSVILPNGFSGTLRYRYLANRAADEQNKLQAIGYLLADAVATYRRGKWEAQLTMENLLDQSWREAQFSTTSRLSFENDPVTGIHFTPGTPRFVKLGLSYNF